MAATGKVHRLALQELFRGGVPCANFGPTSDDDEQIQHQGESSDKLRLQIMAWQRETDNPDRLDAANAICTGSASLKTEDIEDLDYLEQCRSGTPSSELENTPAAVRLAQSKPQQKDDSWQTRLWHLLCDYHCPCRCRCCKDN